MMIFGALVIDERARVAQLDGVALPLTRTEFDLLARLAAEPRVAVPPADLLKAIWDKSWSGDTGAIEAHVSRLRRKLGESARDQGYIRTVRGVGYRFEPNGRDLLAMTGPGDGGVMLTYDRDLNVVSVFPDDRPFFGWQPQDVIGTYFMLATSMSFTHDPSFARAFLQTLVQAGHREVSQRGPVRCADGSTMIADITLSLSVDDTGALTTFSGVARPVSPSDE